MSQCIHLDIPLYSNGTEKVALLSEHNILIEQQPNIPAVRHSRTEQKGCQFDFGGFLSFSFCNFSIMFRLSRTFARLPKTCVSSKCSASRTLATSIAQNVSTEPLSRAAEARGLCLNLYYVDIMESQC